MNLLAEFYSQPTTHAHPLRTDTPLPELIPRLWPMLRHTNPNVRTATLRTAEKLVTFLAPVLSDAMAHVFQEVLVEERDEIREVRSIERKSGMQN